MTKQEKNKTVKHKKITKQSKPSKNQKSKKIFFYIILVLTALYLFLFREELRPVASQMLIKFETFLSGYELIFSGYSHLKDHILSTSYLGIGYVMFFLSLFFIPAPIEIVFAGYLLTGLNPWIIALISAIANTLGHVVDFLLGVLFGTRFLKKSQSKLKNLFEWLKNRASFILVLFNFFPLPAQFISVVYGFIKFNLRKFIVLTFLTRLIKFAVIILLFNYARPLLTSFFGI